MGEMLVRREVMPITVAAGAVTVAVSVGASHAESAAIPAALVRMVSTVAAFIEFGSAPVATVASMYLPAAAPEYFRFTPGQKASVLQVAGAGTLYVTY